MRNSLSIFSLLLIFFSTLPAAAENWPSWRGPRHDGTSLETGLATSWSPTENILWRLPMPGPAASTPAVWGERLYLTSTEGDDLVLMAIDRAGKVAWKKKVDSGNYTKRGGETNAASPSPVTDGKHLWTLFGTGTLLSTDMEGTERWRVNLKERYAPFDLYFGLATSPLLDRGRLYIQLLDGGQQRVVALDAANGKEVWQIERPTDARAECLHSYASPVIYRHGKEEALLVHGADVLTAHRLADGGEVWRVGGLNDPESYNPSLRFVASPVVASDLIVVPSAKNGPVLGLRPEGARGDITKSAQYFAWRLDKNTPDVPSPVVHDGIVYLCRENGTLLALDAASGEQLYAERAHSRPHRGSPVVADGKVFLVSMDGVVTVVKAGRRFEVLASNDLGEQLAASPVVSEGVIYLRTYEALYAIAPAS